jgi:GntR family transcriptional regulator
MLELINVNPHSGEPIYKQLHEQVVRLIVSGKLPSGTTLPSVRQMAEHFSVNPMTVSRAIQQLVEQGWLERRRGQATMVAQKAETEQTDSEELLFSAIDSLICDAKQINITLDTVIQLLNTRWERN